MENSLDAGASVIGMKCPLATARSLAEVRFKEHGLESIEVIDNGSGIKADDWASIGG